MAMTKKHFVELANEMAYIRPTPEAYTDNYMYAGADVKWGQACDAIANACKRANPAFDRDRFIEACNKPWRPLK